MRHHCRSVTGPFTRRLLCALRRKASVPRRCPDTGLELFGVSSGELGATARDLGQPSPRRPKRKPRSPKSAAHQAEYHARWRKTAKGLALMEATSRRWNQRHPEKIKAHRTVSYAIRRGRLVKGPCEWAGVECRGRIEAHHDDYTKPLEVRWLCKKHHKAADQSRRREDVA